MLTATMIETLETYYQNAIRNNASDIKAMKQAIMATHEQLKSIT